MQKTNELYILVVEDDPLVRADLVDCLWQLGYGLAGEAGNYEMAVQALEEQPPDLVLLDIHLGEGEDGVEVARLINQEYLIPFIYLTAYSDPSTLKKVSDSLPAGFVLKPFQENRLKAAIEIARSTYYAVIQPHWRKQEDINQHLPEPLTRRELDLLKLICKGMTYRAMADKLSLSVNTIKTHLKNLYLKLQVSNRAEAIVKVQEIRLNYE